MPRDHGIGLGILMFLVSCALPPSYLLARVIDSDTVYDEPCPLEDIRCGEPLIVIDGNAPPTVLQIVEPGRIVLYDTGVTDPAIWARNTSVVDVSGGMISADFGPGIRASDAATIRIAGGYVGGSAEGILAEGDSYIEIASGDIVSGNDNAIRLRDSATAVISAGDILSEQYAVRTEDNANLTISGGAFGYWDLGVSLDVVGSSQVHITGGEFRGLVRVDDTAVLTIDDGIFWRGVFADDSAEITVTGGSIRDSGLFAEPTAVIDVYGRDFVLNEERLTGTLADGTPIDGFARGNIVLHEIEAFLQPGDANQDLAFDQLDIVQVLAAGQYLTGQPATWGEGDWDGGPGGFPGHPRPGDGVFDQLDIVASLQTGLYMTGPYAAALAGGQATGAAASFAAVPEPTSLVLLVLGLVALAHRRRAVAAVGYASA